MVMFWASVGVGHRVNMRRARIRQDPRHDNGLFGDVSVSHLVLAIRSGMRREDVESFN